MGEQLPPPLPPILHKPCILSLFRWCLHIFDAGISHLEWVLPKASLIQALNPMKYVVQIQIWALLICQNHTNIIKKETVQVV